MNKQNTENTIVRLVDQATPKDKELAIAKDDSYPEEQSQNPADQGPKATSTAVVSWKEKKYGALKLSSKAKGTHSKHYVRGSATINSTADSKLVNIKSNPASVGDKTALNSSSSCSTQTVPEPPSLHRESQIPTPLSSAPGAHRMGGEHLPAFSGGSLDESQNRGLDVVSAHLVTDEEGGNKPHSTQVLVEARPLDKLPVLLIKNRKFQLGFGILVCALVAGFVVGFLGKRTNDSRGMVGEFMQILPTILSEKSLAQLETNGSPQALAVEWIHSIPSHTLLSMERLVQRFALAVFYYSTSGPSWSNNNGWLSDDHECSWFSTSDMPCRVTTLTALGVRDNDLIGTIPEEVGLLSNLTILDLAECGLGSTIPSTLGQLTQLENLYLVSNFLTGTIPQEIWNLTNMRQFGISENGLEGSLSTDIGALTHLEEVSLSDNSLTGPIPTEIGKLTNLMALEASHVSFTGTVPTEIGALSELREIIMEGGTLSGTAPAEIGTLTKLVLLLLKDVTVTNELFSQFGELTDLVELSLEGTNLVGTIPPSPLINLKRLNFLNLDENSLNGTLPTELLSMTNLEYLGLAQNRLNGPLDSLVTLTNLQTLRLDGNSFSGTIPSAFEQFTDVILLELRDNQLSGSIPGRLCTLREERLSLSNGSSSSSEEDPDLDLISVDCGRVECDCCVGIDLAPCP